MRVAGWLRRRQEIRRAEREEGGDSGDRAGDLVRLVEPDREQEITRPTTTAAQTTLPIQIQSARPGIVELLRRRR